MRSVVRAVAVLVAAAALSSVGLHVGLAQSDDVPTVSVEPADRSTSGPNEGRWFAQVVRAGGTAMTSAVVGNSARVPQTVALYGRDLTFGDDGTPNVVDAPPQDAGAWIDPAVDRLTLAPGERRTIDIGISVPAVAEPGDHIGVLVAEAAPAEGDITVVKRVATRLYVTVPGEATRDLDVTDVQREIRGGLFPARIDVQIVLQNTGRIRLEPDVTVNGEPAQGPDALLSQSVEVYKTAVDVPWYGGRVPLDITVDAGDGLVERREGSVLIVPWALIAIVLVLLLSLAILWLLWRTRRRRQRDERDRLEAELRRLRDQVGGSA